MLFGLLQVKNCLRSRDSLVGISTGYGLDGLGSILFSIFSQTGSGARPTSYLKRYRGVKLAGSEADHSPPSSAEVKNGGTISPLPHYFFMAWYLIKHKHNFAFD
jgi:hypothetical protein